MMKKFLKSFIICSSLFLISSCKTMAIFTSAGAIIGQATGVISGDTALSIINASESVAKASEKITPSQEYYIGRAVAGTLIENYGLVNNPELQEYLNYICHTITVNSSKPEIYKDYSIAILDSDEINAFATSGGHILIAKGLLNSVKSEDELASVIAHEISHIHLSHSIKAIKSSRTTEAILKTAGAATTTFFDGDKTLAKFVNDFDEGVGEIFTTMVDSGYSKTQEYEADENALLLLQNSGYNPHAMKNMLSTLNEHTKDKHGFSKTHPSPKSRLNKIQKKLNKMENVEIPQSRIDRFEKYL